MNSVQQKFRDEIKHSLVEKQVVVGFPSPQLATLPCTSSFESQVSKVSRGIKEKKWKGREKCSERVDREDRVVL